MTAGLSLSGNLIADANGGSRKLNADGPPPSASLSAMVPYDRRRAMVAHDRTTGRRADDHPSGIRIHRPAMIPHHDTAWPVPEIARTCRDPRVARLGGRDANPTQKQQGQHSTKSSLISLRHFPTPLKRPLHFPTLHRGEPCQCEACHRGWNERLDAADWHGNARHLRDVRRCCVGDHSA